MRVAGAEVEMSVRRNRARRTGGDAELAFEAWIEVERPGARAAIDVDGDRAEQNEIAERRMDDIAMDAHPSEPRGDCDGLVRDDPHLARPA